jgi:hypothetical protein
MTDEKKDTDHPAASPKPSEHRARMAVPATSPPGLELDGHGNPIPLAQRTREDQEKAAGGSRNTEPDC